MHPVQRKNARDTSETARNAHNSTDKLSLPIEHFFLSWFPVEKRVEQDEVLVIPSEKLLQLQSMSFTLLLQL